MSARNPKKRPAPSQDGPASKKVHIQRQQNMASSKPTVLKDTQPKSTKNVARRATDFKSKASNSKEKEDTKGKKRAVPVTLDPKEDESDSDNDEDTIESRDEAFDQEDEVDDDAMDGQEGEVLVSAKDPKANQESHAAQRALLATRRSAKPHAALVNEAKQIWAEVRKKDLERRRDGTNLSPSEAKQERREKVKQLMELVRGKVLDLVLKHDASRIIQTIVKYGTAEERLEVAKALEGHYLQIVQGKYSKFLVGKVIRYCPTARSFIIQELMPEVPRLIHHGYASSVLADAYEIHCTGAERARLLHAFWGREATLFGDGIDNKKTKLKKKNKDVEALIALREKEQGNKQPDLVVVEEIKEGGLAAVLTASDDFERRRRTLASVKDNLLSLFNNPSPVAARHAITHRVLWEYLEAATSSVLFSDEKFSEQDRERAWREVYESCQEQLAEMVHTREGSNAVREFIARGTAKDRKQIVKVLKPHVLRVAQSDEAQLVLFTALDVIDDTKLTAKQLISELIPTPPTPTLPSGLLTSSAGRRSLLYTIVPRSLRHFTPAIVSALARTDHLRAKTSKKDEAIRRQEVRAAASPGLLSLVKEKGVEMSRDPKGALVVAEILLEAEGDNSQAIQTLLAPLSDNYPSSDPEVPHPIDIPHTSRLYKTLLQGGHYSMTTKSVEPSTLFDAGSFATSFVRAAGKDNILAMASKGGAFVIAELCERLRLTNQGNDVKSWFGQKEIDAIINSDTKGKNVLLEKVELLKSAS